jgi:hypothetical protein
MSLSLTSRPLPTAGPHTGMTTWLEILPLVNESDGVWCLRPPGCDSWRTPHAGGAVSAEVSAHLDAAGLHARVIHSTSWRQERGAVLLTHLAVLAPTRCPGAAFERWRVRRRELARGRATLPAAPVEVEHVVEHALRHLAWLRADDPAVRAALDAAWARRLRGYRREPFRVIVPTIGRPARGSS